MEIYNFEIGQSVKHETFGEGKVVRVEPREFCGVPDRPIVEVAFGENDTRTFTGFSLTEHLAKEEA